MALPRPSSSPEELSPSLAVFPGAHNINVRDVVLTQINQYSAGNVSELFQLLNPITDASYKRNRRVAPPDSHCMDGTRIEVLAGVRTWANQPSLPKPFSPSSLLPPQGNKSGNSNGKRRVKQGHDSISVGIFIQHICWMYGHGSCGKSAIAQKVAEELAGNDKLGASFFFFRDTGDRSNMNRLAATLAHQISQNIPGAKPFIESAIKEDHSLLGQACSLASQLEDLVFKPCLKALCADDHPAHDCSPYVIVIDGLDECNDKEGVETFIDYAILFFTRHPTIPLRLFITSRIEEHIQARLHSEEIHLIDLASKFSCEDLSLYMKTAFSRAAKQDRALRTQGGTWPEPEELNKLIDYCDGSFIIGSTLVKFILGDPGDNDPRTPMERLLLALEMDYGLDGVYMQVLSRCRHLPHFHLIISTLAVIREPLSISALSALLYVSTYKVVRVLANLQAIIQVPGSDDVPVTLFHTSLRDFLVNRSRSGDFYVPPSYHTFLTDRCLNLLFGPHSSNSEECCRYAIIYWTVHWASALTKNPSFDYEKLETPEHWLDALHRPPWGITHPEVSHSVVEILLSEVDFHSLKAKLNGAMTSYLTKMSRFPAWLAKYGERDVWDCPSGWQKSRTSEEVQDDNKLESLTPCSSVMVLEGLSHMLSPKRKPSPAINPLIQLSMESGEGGCINVVFDRTAVEGFSSGSPERLGVKISITRDIPATVEPPRSFSAPLS